MPVPGEYILGDEPVPINAGRPVRTVEVTNTGDRPVQVGSHFHFFEVNPALRFDRAQAFGFRLDVPAGTAVRFEPGDTRSVRPVALGGTRRVSGLNRLTEGETSGHRAAHRALARAREEGFLGADGPGGAGGGPGKTGLPGGGSER